MINLSTVLVMVLIWLIVGFGLQMYLRKRYNLDRWLGEPIRLSFVILTTVMGPFSLWFIFRMFSEEIKGKMK